MPRAVYWNVRLPAAAVLALLLGCGYTSDPLHRADIRTVYVPVMENRTFRRGVELELTRSVIDEINTHTQMRVVSEAQADSSLIGTVRDVKETVLTKTPGDEMLEKQITVYVSFKWVDRRTGRILVERRDVRATADAVLSTETFARSRQRAFERAARKIVRLMEHEW
jgi:hypothetical protein